MAEEMIRLCALMLDPYDTSPGQRFRIEQWEPYLRKAGIGIDYFSFTDEKLRQVLYKEGHTAAKIKGLIKANFRRLNHMFNASAYDAVYLYRAASMIGPAWMEKFLSRRKIPIIFDFDDAIFLTDTSKVNKKFAWAKFSGKTADICRLSTSVTVGNSYLAEYALKYNSSVFIVPTSIDTTKYKPNLNRNVEQNSRLVIGWTGSSTSQYHLEAFEPILVKISDRFDVEIRVISDREPDFQRLPYVWIPWTAATEVKETLKFDIGIMPLPDNEWTRGKCAAKALICMALGLPVICSEVGTNREVIESGKNGFLANGEDDWMSAVQSLIENVDTRRSIGLEARKTVEQRYSMEICAAEFSRIVRNTVDKSSIKN